MIRAFRRSKGSGLGGLRWFAAEFLVVVTGVLVALALGGWWQDREEREREAEYLQQLLTDLERSERALGEIGDFHADAWRAADRVSEAFWSPPEALDEALLEDLMTPLRSSRARPIMGTIDALIATGDLRLVRSDRLRADLVAYSEFAEAMIENIQRHDETYYRTGQNDLRHELDHRAVRWLAQANDDASEDSTQENSLSKNPPFPVTAEDLFSSRRIYSAYNALSVAHRNQAGNYFLIMERARQLRGEVHRYLNATLDPGNCQLTATPDGFIGSCGDPEAPGHEFEIELVDAPPEAGKERSLTGTRIHATGPAQSIHLHADELGNGSMRMGDRRYEVTGGLVLTVEGRDRLSFRLHLPPDETGKGERSP